jgi:hypothetical protein
LQEERFKNVGKVWTIVSFTFIVVETELISAVYFTEDDFRNFRENPESYQKFRKEVELELQSVHGVTIRGSAEQAGALEYFTANMKARLAKKPAVAEQLMPSFPPVCRRLTPGPGYLEALVEPNVNFISTPIEKIVEDGVITSDGKLRKADGIVCATGFDTSFTGRYPIYGVGGVRLAERWKNAPETYISVATDGFPNYFTYLGPNSGLGTGNLLILLEKMADYFTDCVAKMQREDIASMAVKPESVRAFVDHCDKYFERTVFTMNCRSWYKGGTVDGRVSALWPGMSFSLPVSDGLNSYASNLGSSLHAMATFAHPRWEDFEYVHRNANPFGWFGNGWTQNEIDKNINVDYLNAENIDFPVAKTGKADFADGRQEVVVNGANGA